MNFIADRYGSELRLSFSKTVAPGIAYTWNPVSDVRHYSRGSDVERLPSAGTVTGTIEVSRVATRFGV
jgi:hypothetical protein